MESGFKRHCSMVSTASWRSGVKVMAVLLLIVRENIQGARADTVYFNSYGQCNSVRHPDYSLQDEVYTARATGDAEMHETLLCDMTFRAPPSSGVCLTFRKFDIRDPSVALYIYQKQTAGSKDDYWKRLSAEDDVQEYKQMCTPERFVTLRLQKIRLNNNKGYSFEIQIEKSSNFKGEDVILASSLGLFVSIIGGVVALIVFIAVIVLCCCCKPCRSQQLYGASGYSSSGKDGTAGHEGTMLARASVVPSAPPALDTEDETLPLQQHHQPQQPLQDPSAGPPLYPVLPQHKYPVSEQPRWPIPEQPPPYDPPPYEQHAANTYPSKN